MMQCPTLMHHCKKVILMVVVSQLLFLILWYSNINSVPTFWWMLQKAHANPNTSNPNPTVFRGNVSLQIASTKNVVGPKAQEAAMVTAQMKTNKSVNQATVDLGAVGVKTTSGVYLDDTVVRSFYTNVKHDTQSAQFPIVAVGMGITTRKLKLENDTNIGQSLAFFETLLPSFCITSSPGFNYRFFLSFDYNDVYLTNPEFMDKFGIMFRDNIDKYCKPTSSYSLHFVRCNHTKKPAWAQNDAMIEAYLSGAEYFYRINDDTKMLSKGWTEAFIQVLGAMKPPNVGVVGPNHRGGNKRILTYDFTHRTHMEIFGFYYPRDFPDWYGDGWISDVYKPGRAVKMTNVILLHVMGSGRRYQMHRMNRNNVVRVISREKRSLIRYIRAREKKVSADPGRVISMSYRDTSSHYWGLVRNAQLTPVIFPGWTLRVYVTNTSLPSKISQTLVRLGAQVKMVPDDIRVSEASRDCLGYLVADDLDVDVFLMRNADERLIERDTAAVRQWLSGTQTSDGPLAHVIRDQPNTVNTRLVRGQWGAKAKPLRARLGQSMADIIRHSLDNTQHTTCDNVLENIIYPKINDTILCHDSINCAEWSACKPYPNLLKTEHFVGEKYDIYNSQAGEGEVSKIISMRIPKCHVTRT